MMGGKIQFRVYQGLNQSDDQMTKVKDRKSKLEHPNSSLPFLDLSRNFSRLLVDLKGKNIEQCHEF